MKKKSKIEKMLIPFPFSKYVHIRISRKINDTMKILITVPLGDWLERKKVTAIIIKQQFGVPIGTT